MNDNDTLADDHRKDSLALMALLEAEKRKSERLEAALRTIQQWDCLNPPAVELLQDLSWLRKLVSIALDGPPAATNQWFSCGNGG